MAERRTDGSAWRRALAAAFLLMTRFPVPRADKAETDPAAGLDSEIVLRRCVVLYPVVGLAIGAVLAAAGAGLGIGMRHFVPPPVAGALLMVLWVWMTGGLHLDGLMDTADGVLSGRPRERMLEIMKDNRAGAMGVIACALLLLVKTSLLIAWLDLLADAALDLTAVLLVLVPVWSRWFAAAAIAGWKPAREEGMASRFRPVRLRDAAASLAVALAVSAAAILAASGSLVAAVLGSLAFAAASAICGSFAAARMARRLGGLTGDTYGALIEGLETVLLLGAVIGLAAAG